MNERKPVSGSRSITTASFQGTRTTNSAVPPLDALRIGNLAHIEARMLRETSLK
jgi:hypothetical protein